MSDGPFPRDRELTAIAIAYKNPTGGYIADKVLPRVPVGKRTFNWWEYDLEQSYQVVKTLVGERSKVPMVELTGTRRESTCEDYGLDIPLTKSDIDEAPKGVDPKAQATEQSADFVHLERECNVATMCFNAANYPSSQKADLSGIGDTQFDDADADPLVYIAEKLDGCQVRPNKMVFGQPAWSKLRTHAKVVKACNGNDGGNGLAMRERIAELLELDEILVGRSFYNSVKPGKTPVLARAWGKHALAFYCAPNVGTAGGMTFGYTATLGTFFGGFKAIDIGLLGGTAVRAGEIRKEIIAAPYAAFLFQNAVS